MQALQRWMNDSTPARAPFEDLVDTLLRDWPFGDFARWSSAGEKSTPAVDVSETPDTYVVKADVPGVDPQKLSISVEDDVVVLKAERDTESEHQSEGYRYSERTFGKYERAFRLPKSVDASKADATYERGVLTLVLPKREEAKPRAIQVRVLQP